MLSNNDADALIKALSSHLTFDSKIKKIKQNLIEFSTIYKESLSEKSRMLALLTKSFTLLQSSIITNLAVSSIIWARNQLRRGIHFRAQTISINPLNTSEDEREWFKKIVFDISHPYSGTTQRRLPYCTYTEFYNTFYLNKLQETQYVTRSLPTIISMLKEIGVKRTKFDKYRCAICYEGRIAETKPPTQEIQKVVEEYLDHKALCDHQKESYKKQKENLKSHQLLIVYDYSTFHEYSKKKFRNLSMLIYYQGERMFHDSIASEKQDYRFTEAAWTVTLNALFKEGYKFGPENINEIIVWSDGGLKTKENLFLFIRIAMTLKIRMVVNFFGPYHGHSEVDAHYGQVKSILRNRAGAGPVITEQQIFDAVESLPNTTIHHITPIKSSFLVKPLKRQIRKWFEWVAEPNGDLKCRELTDIGNFVHQEMKYQYENQKEIYSVN